MKNSTLQKEISEYRQKFYKIYNDSLLPIFRQYEPKRKKQLVIFYMLSLLPILCVIFAIYATFFSTNPILNDYSDLILQTSLAFLAFILVIVFMIYSFFISNLKSECMSKILKAFGNIKWSYKSFITEYELLRCELFDTNLSIGCDDSFFGNYRDINFKVSDLALDGDGAKRIFKGVIFSFKFNKKITNKTFITSKADKSMRKNSKPFFWEIIFIVIASIMTLAGLFVLFTGQIVGLFGTGVGMYLIYLCYDCIAKKRKKISAVIKDENFKRIELEDVEFNKKYLAYSSDEVEGRYLITPAFMERLKNLQITFGSNKIKCSFFDDNITFAIATRKNLFEIGNLFRPLTNPKTMDKFFSEITSIYLMIDYFKLDESTKL